jgi:hypothetical protein
MLFREESLNRKNEQSTGNQVSCQKFEDVYEHIDFVNVQKLIYDEDRYQDWILKRKVSEYKMPRRVPTVGKYCSVLNICRGSTFGRRWSFWERRCWVCWQHFFR